MPRTPLEALLGGPPSGRPVPKKPEQAPAKAREKMPSLEEISGSLLLPDPGSSSTLPGLEELSGSLLLEDPTEVRDDLRAVPMAEPSQGGPTPAAGAPPPAALEMPALPKATPGPDLDQLPTVAMAAISRDTLRPAVAPAPAEAHPTSESLQATVVDPNALPPQPGPDGVPPPPAHMYGVLQGYEATGPVPPPSGMQVDATDRNDPLNDDGPSPTAPVHGDVEVTALPRSRMSTAMETVRGAFEQMKAAMGDTDPAHEPRRRLYLAGIALAGLALGVAVVSIVVSLSRKGSDETEARTETTASASAAPAPVAPAPAAPAASETAQATAAPPPAEPASEPPSSTAPCKVVGKPRVIAPSAIVPAGIEVRTVGNDVALGFAPNEHQATAVRVDAATLSTSTTVDGQSGDAIRRVVPLEGSDGAMMLASDADRDGDVLRGRRTVALEPAIDIGASGGNLVWARAGGPAAGTLWPLEGDGNVEAVRAAVELGPSGPIMAVALRMGSNIWVGTATAGSIPAAQGPLSKAGTSTGSVGSPAVAINDGVILAAWADRVSSSDPWRLRWVRFKAGEAPGEAGTFTPPAGGKGEQAMSPGITAVPGGRFLLVWTEGPTSRHDVRALTLSREGQPIGKPLVISNKTSNSGQGQAAVNASRQGLVAFLESTEAGGFQVMATPVACAP